MEKKKQIKKQKTIKKKEGNKLKIDYKSYIKSLQESKIKLANLRYLLIYEKEKSLNYVEGIDLDILVDNYDKEISNEKEALNIVLKKVNSNKGSLFELVNGEYIEKASKK